MANLADITVGVGADLSEFDSGMVKVPGKAAEAADGAVSKWEAMGPKLAAAAKGAAVAAGAALVIGATEGLERERIGDKLAGQLRLSEPESKAAGNIAGKLYAGAYGDSLEDVNNAVAGIVGGSLADLGDAEGVERLSAKALDVAATFDGDVGDAIGNAGVLVKSGLAGDADEAFDLIVASSQKVAPAIRDELADATKEYSKHFGDLGITGTEALGLLSAADDQFELDKTGDAIKELSIRATDMSSTSTAAFELMGADAGDMADRILAGGDTARGAFDDIIDGLLGIEDPTEQAQAAIALFGTPLEDLGTGQIPAFLGSLDSMGDSLGDVSGRADELGDTLNDNAATKIEGFRRKVEGMLAKVVEAPGILGDMAVAAGGMGQILEPVGPAIAGVGYIFRDQLGRIAAGFASSIGTAVSWAAGVAAQGARGAASMAVTAAQFVAKWALMGAQALLHAAKVAAAWLIAMGPIALVIAAVAGLVALVVIHFDTIKAAIGSAWEWIKSTTSSVWDAIKGALSAVWSAITGAVSSAVASVQSTIAGAWNAVQGATSRAWEAVKSAVSGAWAALYSTVVSKGAEVVAWMTALPGKLTGALAGMLGLLVGKGREILTGLLNGMLEGWRTVSTWAAGLGGYIVTNVGNLGSRLVSAGRDLLEGMIRGIGQVAGRLIKAVTDPISGAINAGKSLLGINSPSKVFAEIGAGVGEGFVLGMAGMRGDVSKAGAMLADAAIPSLDSTLGMSPLNIGAAVRPGAGVVGARAGEPAAAPQAARVDFPDPDEWGRVAARSFGRAVLMDRRTGSA